KLLRGCSIADLDVLGQSATIIRCTRGEMAAAQADGSGSVFFVPFGRLRLRYLNDDGRELILTDIQPGEFFGEESLAALAVWRASAVALEEATVVRIAAQDLAAFLSTRSRIALQFALHVVQQLQTARTSLASVALLSVEDRLLGMLDRIESQGDAFPTHSEL